MKYNLVGQDGNAFFLMGYTSNAMKQEGFSKAEIDAVMKRAQSSDYPNLLCVLDEAIQNCNERAGDSADDYEDEDDWCNECDNPYSECICDDEDFMEGDCPDCGKEDLQDGVCYYCGYEE